MAKDEPRRSYEWYYPLHYAQRYLIDTAVFNSMRYPRTSNLSLDKKAICDVEAPKLDFEALSDATKHPELFSLCLDNHVQRVLHSLQRNQNPWLVHTFDGIVVHMHGMDLLRALKKPSTSDQTIFIDLVKQREILLRNERRVKDAAAIGIVGGMLFIPPFRRFVLARLTPILRDIRRAVDKSQPW